MKKILFSKIFSSKLAFYYYKYIGIFSLFNPLSSDIEGSNRVLILGKGASLKNINKDKLHKLIKNSDYRILASSVDIENNEILRNFTYDIQFTSRVDNLEGFCPVYPMEIIKKFSIKGLCINSNKFYKNGIALARYKKFFYHPNINLFDTGLNDGFTPISDEPSLFGGEGLSMVQVILKQIMATKSVKEIVLLGIDFYGTGYLDADRNKKEKELKLFYPISISKSNSRNSRGIPFLKYIYKLTQNKFFNNRFKIIIPKEIEPHIPENILHKLSKQKSIKIV